MAMKKNVRACGLGLCVAFLLAGLAGCQDVVAPPLESETPTPVQSATPAVSTQPPAPIPTPTPTPVPVQLPEMPPLPWTQLLGKPDVSRMMEDIDYICRMPRNYGSSEERAIAAWAAERLSQLGFETAVQEAGSQGVEYTQREGESQIFVMDFLGSKSVNAGPVSGTSNGSVKGTLKFISAQSDLEADMQDIICLIPPGMSDIEALLHEASKRGCKGAILNAMEIKNALNGPNFEDGIVAVSVSNEDGVKLMTRWVQGDEVSVTLSVKGSSWDFATQNVIATRKAQTDRPADIIIIAAHMDSMVDAPGATDNACGVAAVMECARLLQNFVGDAELRLILFGAEEGGALGARAYVSKLGDDERARIRGMLNLDMFASSAAGAPGFVGSTKINDTLRNAIISAQSVRALDVFKNITFAKKETATGDHQAFSEKEISALMIAHRPVTDEYHTPDDTPDKIDKDKLAWVCETAAAWAASQIHPVS